MSWLRTLGLRVVVGCALFLTLVATHMAVSKARLPFVLLDSVDKALSLADAAADRRTEPDAPATLDELEAHILVACDAATDLLDDQLARRDQLSPARREAALACVQHHLTEARAALVRANDPAEYAEYDATCERLRDVRRLLG